tara:strand:- start:245 stop:700 length:456 start_codon:yes stop_codon:yes gene_type:complete
MANFYSGSKGKLFVGDADEGISVAADEVAKVRSWSFTVNTAVLETVSLGDHDRTIIPGISSGSGSASIYYYAETTTGENNSGVLSSKIISTIITSTSKERSRVRFRLQSDADHRIDFDAVITSLNMTNSVGEVLSANVNFDIDGIAHFNKF